MSARTVVIVVMLGVTPLAAAQGPRDRDVPLVEILEGLEHGLVALERLERYEELEVLRRVADEVRREMNDHRRRAERRGGDRERQVARRQIEALELALPALRESGHRDGAELIELAILRREMTLRQRGGRDARRGAPGRDHEIELLNLAEQAYLEFDMPDRAELIGRLTDELWHRNSVREHRRDERGPRRGERRHDVAHGDLDVMETALHALMEGERRDAAELLERAIRAREADLQGRHDRAAERLARQAPPVGRQVEILRLAASLWREFGHPQRAEAVADLAERLWMAPGPHRHRPQRDAFAGQLDELRQQLTNLQATLDDLREEVRALD